MENETIKIEVEIPKHYVAFLKDQQENGYNMAESVKACLIFDGNEISKYPDKASMTHEIQIMEEL